MAQPSATAGAIIHSAFFRHFIIGKTDLALRLCGPRDNRVGTEVDGSTAHTSGRLHPRGQRLMVNPLRAGPKDRETRLSRVSFTILLLFVSMAIGTHLS